MLAQELTEYEGDIICLQVSMCFTEMLSHDPHAPVECARKSIV
jgi:hypothetical protein